MPDQLGDGGTVVVGYDGSLQAARTLAAYVATGLARSAETVVVTIDEAYEEATRVSAIAPEVRSTKSGVKSKTWPQSLQRP